jgi:hypothetical protein
MVHGGHVDERPTRSVPLTQLEKERHRPTQAPESLVEPALGSAQGSVKIEQYRLLEEISRPALKALPSSSECLFSALKVRLDPAAVPYISPGAGSQVLEAPGAVAAGIQTI